MDQITGRHPVLTALEGNTLLERIYIQDSISGSFEKQIRTFCDLKSIPLNRVPKVKLDRIAKANHQGICALVSEISYQPLPDLVNKLISEHQNPVILLLDGIQDVRNLGAIARSAEVFGAHALIVPYKKSAAINEVAIKASAGALLQLPLSRVKSLQTALDILGAEGFVVVGAETGAEKNLSELTLDGPMAIILGAEGKGIDRHLKIYCDHLFQISQSGKIESLNVSVASGIILYEIFKQRKRSFT